MPTTRPVGPTVRAKSRLKLPVPHATSSTPSPGESASSSRAIRCSSAMPGPSTPLNMPAERGAPPALVDARHRAAEHQVLDEARGARLLRRAQEVQVAARGPACLRPRLRAQQVTRVRGSWGGRARAPGSARASRSRARARPAARSRARPRAGRMVRREAGDQRPDPVAELEREVRRRRAHQLAHVLDGRLAAAAVWALVLAHRAAAFQKRWKPAAVPTARSPAPGRAR